MSECSDSVRTLPQISNKILSQLERNGDSISIGSDLPEANCCIDSRLGSEKLAFVVESPLERVIHRTIR